MSTQKYKIMRYVKNRAKSKKFAPKSSKVARQLESSPHLLQNSLLFYIIRPTNCKIRSIPNFFAPPTRNFTRQQNFSRHTFAIPFDYKFSRSIYQVITR